MAGTFICPDCGKEARQVKTNNRRFCPECMAKRTNQKRTEFYQNLYKENKKIRLASGEKRKEPDEIAKAKAEHDEKQDARSREYIQKQCRFCKYQLREGSNNQMRCIGCEYILKTGHRADTGNGPGDCRSFERMKKETKAERIARSREALLAVEANNAQNTGEKMRKVNT